MKISDLYPEDINAMQISFATLRVGRAVLLVTVLQVPGGTLLLAAQQSCSNSGHPHPCRSPMGQGFSPPCFLFPSWAPHRFQVEETALDTLKITFENSTDFFGRVVVYHLQVLGERL